MWPDRQFASFTNDDNVRRWQRIIGELARISAIPLDTVIEANVLPDAFRVPPGGTLKAFKESPAVDVSATCAAACQRDTARYALTKNGVFLLHVCDLVLYCTGKEFDEFIHDDDSEHSMNDNDD